MRRIEQAFAARVRDHQKVLIGYVTAGFPNTAALRQIVPQLERAGVDILEIGIPFSDPIADGPTIQKASQIALEQGATLRWTIEEAAALRKTVSLPIVFMSYSNPIYKMGIDAFFAAAKGSGVDGVIIPDLISEEAEPFQRAAEQNEIDLIFLVAPTSPPTRIRRVARTTRGFLYAVSLSGVTGARSELPKGLPEFLRHVKAASPVPVAVGFGLSTADHVRAVAPYADGVIIGSALIKEIEKSQSQGYAGAAEFMRTLRGALDQFGKEVSHASR